MPKSIRKNLNNWTILMYANGNNEMEPEMFACLTDMEKMRPSKNINILIQLGRANRKLVEKMRPSEVFNTANDDTWEGVRRYYINHNSSILLESLGNINMADPIKLNEFIEWGIKSYPAENYMLIMSGHGISFVGGIIDICQKTPYYMGTPEMCKAINLAVENTKIQIDILVLDMCYMNYLEILYEFISSNRSTVKYIVTYRDKGPFKGLPYDKFIYLTKKFSYNKNLVAFLTALVHELGPNTVAFKVNTEKLQEIKSIFNSFAYGILKEIENDSIIASLKLNFPKLQNKMIDFLICISSKLLSLILCTDNCKIILNDIRVVKDELGKLTAFYSKMSFAKNNYWTNLLNCTPSYINLSSTEQIELKPSVLSDSVFLTLISELNPTYDNTQLSTILQMVKNYVCEK